MASNFPGTTLSHSAKTIKTLFQAFCKKSEWENLPAQFSSSPKTKCSKTLSKCQGKMLPKWACIRCSKRKTKSSRKRVNNGSELSKARSRANTCNNSVTLQSAKSLDLWESRFFKKDYSMGKSLKFTKQILHLSRYWITTNKTTIGLRFHSIPMTVQCKTTWKDWKMPVSSWSKTRLSSFSFPSYSRSNLSTNRLSYRWTSFI